MFCFIGYGQQQQSSYYNQQRRYPQQYNRGYSNNRGYGQQNRQSGYGQQRRGYSQNRGNNRTGGDKNENQAGTGAFLDNRRLRGDEIDIKDQQDFDFGAAKNEFDLSKDQLDAEQNGVPVVAVNANIDTVQNGGVDDKDKDKDNKGGGDDDKKDAVAANNDKGGDDDEEETKEDDDNKKYDKTKSFFDGLQTETKKSKPKQDMQTQKDVDTSTFGSVAATYKSRHINRQNQGRGYRNNQNRRYNYNQNQNYDNRQQRSYQQYNRQYNQQYVQRQQQQQQNNYNNYNTNKWVVK